MEFINTIMELMGDLPLYVGLAVQLLSALIAIALVIPGDQPEKFLQSILDFIKKFSKK